MYANVVKAYHFKTKETKPYPLFLGHISKDFTVNIMKKKWIEWKDVPGFC